MEMSQSFVEMISRGWSKKKESYKADKSMAKMLIKSGQILHTNPWAVVGGASTDE